MTMARRLLEQTDWDSLEHAYGRATEAAEALPQLLSGVPDACGAVLGYLDSAILHQGSLYTATAPVVSFVVEILDDPLMLTVCKSALPWDDRERPLRAALLEWLGHVAESVAHYDGQEGPAEEPVTTCRALRLDMYRAVAPFIEDPDVSIRTAVGGALLHLLSAPELAEARNAEAERLQRVARGASFRERMAIALTLGRWNRIPPAFLEDEHPGVRATAALAPAFEDDPRALAEIRQALLDPAGADAWIDESIPQLEGWLRFSLVAALLRRTNRFEEVRDQALAIARMSNAFTVDFDWGPLLLRAFPTPHDDGRPLTEAQCAFLGALAANDACWEGCANPMLWFHKAGLPDRRGAIREMLA